MRRRDFVQQMTAGTLALLAGCLSRSSIPKHLPQRLFFTSAGKTCLVDEDGAGFEPLDFREPNQVTWQPGPFLSDGKRVIFLSTEERRDGPGRPFDQYYTLTPTHL